MIDGILGGGEAARSHVVGGVDSLRALELVRWRRGGEEVGVHAVGEGCGRGGWLDGRLVRGGGGVGCGGLLSHIVAVLLPRQK